MRIGITGVPGTGKTTLAKLLAERLNYSYININDIVNSNNLWVSIDPQDDAKVVNLKALESFIKKNLKDDVIYDGHLLCELNLPLDRLFVLRTPPKILYERLSSRGYSPQKIKSNLYSELMDYCLNKSLRNYPKPIICEILTTSSITDELDLLFSLTSSSDCSSHPPGKIDIFEEEIKLKES